LALQKTLVFILLIAIGYVLRTKFNAKSEIKGIKAIILNVALPSTIFIALLKIEIQSDILLLPILALGLNIILFTIAKYFLPHLGIGKNRRYRTILLLFASFAPGLSCFPFLIEFFGEQTLASAAFADVGNKCFGLLILYFIAMRWYEKGRAESVSVNVVRKIWDTTKVLVREPINMVLIAGISLLCLGYNYNALPPFLSDAVGRLSMIMTPLVLLFIGLSMRVSKHESWFILQVLLLRSALTFTISGIVLLCLPKGISNSILVLLVLFPQSSCSFWPYAHMSAVESLIETKDGNSIFDLDLAINILAFSLPLSTLIILGLSSYPSHLSNPWFSLILAFFLFGIVVLPKLFIRLTSKKFEYVSLPSVLKR